MSARVDTKPGSGSVLGIFVGGRSLRFGGRPKGLLPVPGPGGPIVRHLADLGASLGMSCVLVGDGPAVEDYRAVLPSSVGQLSDEPAGVGPLGGLAALLAHAGARPAVALAC